MRDGSRTRTCGGWKEGSTHKYHKEVRLPSEAGIDPVSWLLERSLKRTREKGVARSCSHGQY